MSDTPQHSQDAPCPHDHSLRAHARGEGRRVIDLENRLDMMQAMTESRLDQYKAHSEQWS